MSDRFLNLADAERQETLGVAASNSGRPAHLLEKDVWVVWCQNALFSSPLGEHLVFIFVRYDPLETGSGYVSSAVMLKFGARSTGEPSELDVVCDATEYL